MTQKNPKRQRQGAINKARGKRFEERIENSFAYYGEKGFAVIEKTPEPMRPIKSAGSGKFIAFFEKKAQPDYTGTIKGGRAVRFEAKFTSTDRVEQSRVLEVQASNLDRHQRLGARCYVIVGFLNNEVYRIPWAVWREMKERYGRKYITEKDIQEFRVATARNDTLMLLD